MNTSVDYHLKELEIALDDTDKKHSLPQIKNHHKSILDIGCGVGQFFVASELCDDTLAWGIDIDQDALQFGHKNYPSINFIRASGDSLPFKDNSFDFIVSRVSLPYTDIVRSIDEISRVLKPNGEIWLTLHSFSLTKKHLKRSISAFDLKDIIYRTYVLLNGLSLHFFGKVFRFPFLDKMESCQSKRGITRLLNKSGFKDINTQTEKTFSVIATLEKV